MNDGRSQLDVPHPLPTHTAVSHFDAAAIADHALVFHATVLSAGTFPVFFRPENSLAEQTVPLRSICPVVNRLGLLDFAERPAPNVMRAGERNPDRSEIVNSFVTGRFAVAHTRPLIRWLDMPPRRREPSVIYRIRPMAVCETQDRTQLSSTPSPTADSERGPESHW